MTSRRRRVGPAFDPQLAIAEAKMNGVDLLRWSALQALSQLGARTLGRMAKAAGVAIEEIGDRFVQDDQTAREKMFKELAQAGVRSMRASYGQVVTAREGPASRTHYRAGTGRDAGGKMLQALGSADFFSATANGLQWGNIQLLDDTARQWHRLNFGAGGRAGGASESYNVPGTGLSLGLHDGPSPSFSMPAGMWLDDENRRHGPDAGRRGMDAFYPRRKLPGAGQKLPTHPDLHPAAISKQEAASGDIETRGIKGRHFMDAGVRRMARDLPIALDAYKREKYMNVAKVNRRIAIHEVVRFQAPEGLFEVQVP